MGMRTRWTARSVCLSLAMAAVLGVGVPGVALAAGRAVPAVAGSVGDAAAEKAWVRYLALTDSRSVVRIAAWQALLSSTPDAAIAEFMDSGYAYAVGLSERQQAVNADFAQRVLDTYPASFSPAVHEAAQRAVNSHSPAVLAQFASGGFAEARRKDSAARASAGERVAALAAADRAVVRELAAHALGGQVRVSASYAVRVGATDADVVDFFAGEWGFAARLDLDVHRRTGADHEMRWRANLSWLLASAGAAEHAAQDASGSAAEQSAAVAALDAWQAVVDATGDARTYWGQARRDAQAQAAQWGQIAARAATEGANWDAIAATAGGTQDAWTCEADTASSRRAYWDDILAAARSGQARVRAVTPAAS